MRGGKVLDPPVLSGAFRKIEKGRAKRSGYYFRVFLCDKDGKPIGEQDGTQNVDARLAQTTWCAYAWPIEQGKTGKRSFFVNQWGDILAVEHKGYSGDAGPRATAAFAAQQPKTLTITGPSAIGTEAADGNAWKPVR